SNIVPTEPAGNLCELAHLRRRKIPERQGDGSGNITFLLLAIDVRGVPGFKPLRTFLSVQKARSLQRFLRIPIQIRKKARPAGVMGQYLPLFKHEPPKFVDTQVFNKELDASLSAILLFAEPGKNSCDGLSDRQ